MEQLEGNEDDLTKELMILIAGNLLILLLLLVLACIGVTIYCWIKPATTLAGRIFLTAISGGLIYLTIKYWPGIQKILQECEKIHEKSQSQNQLTNFHFFRSWEI
jgi:hypothetical protein